MALKGWHWINAFALLLGVARFTGQTLAQPPPVGIPTMQTIDNAWRKHAAAIQSGRFTWTRRQEMPRRVLYEDERGVGLNAREGTHVSEGTCTFVFDGNRSRLEVKGSAPSSTSPSELTPVDDVFVFDGLASKEYRPKIGERKVPQLNLLGTENVVTKDVRVTPLMWNLRPVDATPGIQKWEIGLTKDEGTKSLLITLTAPKQPSSSRREVWLDPSKDYSIVRYIATDPNSGKQQKRSDVFLSHDTTGGWIPSSWTVIERLGENLTSVIVSKVNDYSINVQPDEKLFHVEVPENVLVLSREGKEVHVPGSSRYLWLAIALGLLGLLAFYLRARRGMSTGGRSHA
jgi:hypothetical protein